MERKESFVFYASFAEALAELDDAQRLQLYDAIVWYALDGIAPTTLTGVCKIIWHLIEPQIRANYERWKKGCKGGRPNKEENEKPVVKHDVKPNVNENENENENENVNDNVVVGKPTTRTTFTKPTIELVERYVLDHGYNMDAREFYDYYEANGWMVGKNKMKSWTAAVSNWNRREKEIRPRRTQTVAMPNALVAQPDFYDD